VWFSLVGANRLLPAIAAWLYRGEGSASLGPDTCHAPALKWAAAFLMAGVTIHVALGFLGLLPLRLMQPVSLLYVGPFLLIAGLTQRVEGSPFMLLWPVLYTIHAGLVLGGAPIQFGKGYDAPNMLEPVVGYGLLAALAGHVYSRFALRRLRALAARAAHTSRRPAGEG